MKTLLRAFIFFAVIQTTNAQTFNPALATLLQDSLNYYVAAVTNVKGMSASVYLPGQGQWKGTAGVSYAGNPITTDMKFCIASNTKLFVASTMLILQENNILDLDDAISNYLPTYTNISPSITIRQLLNHTSGVSDPLFSSPWMDTINNNSTRLFTSTEVLGWVGAPVYAPGAGWNYSNINYILAGMVAQSATGYSISQLIRDSILTPLNMDSTFYDVQEASVGTVAHRWWNTIDYNDTSTVGISSAGGCAGSIYSTAGEMAHWYNALFSGQVLNPLSMAELSNFVNTPSSTYDYGLGLARETTVGKTYWGHGGSIWGYKSKMIYDTCMKAVVCGLVNSHPAGMDGITYILYRVLLNHLPACPAAITGLTTVCQGQNSVTYAVPAVLHASTYIWTLPSGATGTSTTTTITVNYGLSAVSGTITVKGLNSYGWGGEASLDVTLNPKPTIPVVTQNGNTVQSSAAAGNQWYNQNGIINGATAQNYTVTADGDYYVVVTLLNCSSDNSNTQSVVITGIETVENTASIKVYPNPFSQDVIIESPSPETTTAAIGYEISNSFGQVVIKGAVNRKVLITTSTLSPGIYFVKLSTATQTEYRKILKQ